MKSSFKIETLSKGKSSRSHISRCIRRKKIRNYKKLVTISLGIYNKLCNIDTEYLNINKKYITSRIIKDLMKCNVTYDNFISRDIFRIEENDEVYLRLLFRINIYNNSGDKITPKCIDENYNVIYESIDNNECEFSLNYVKDRDDYYIYDDNFNGIPEIFIIKSYNKEYVYNY